jgi:hypothetical protein
MSGAGGYTDDEGHEMKRRIGDDDIEQIMQGGKAEDPSLGALGELITDLGRADEIAPATAAAHIAAAATLARETSAIPAAQASPPPWYRRLVIRAAQLGLAAKIMLGAAVAVAATGGAAATGFLPNPIQTVIADSASHLGIDLPNPRHTSTTTTEPDEESDEGVASTIATTTTLSTDDDGDDGDIQITEGATVGTHIWASTSCAGAAISIEYAVAADGQLAVGPVTGLVDDVDADDDRIRVRFGDGVRVDIRIGDDGLTVDEDRSCFSDDSITTTTMPDTTTTTTTEADDDDTTTTTEADDDDDTTTTTTTEADDDDTTTTTTTTEADEADDDDDDD